MKKLVIIKRTLLSLTLLLILCSNNRANHIIGGIMSYECVGDGTFLISINMYRDCECTDCASFDTDASIAVYNCGNKVDCGNFLQGQTILNGAFLLDYTTVNNVAPPEFACLEPPDVCVSEARYSFLTSAANLNLEANGEPYVFTYQRCCRNDDIVNLTSPSDDQGSTFSIIISPEAIELCNSSPVFNSFPPTVVCNDFNFEFDHGATDRDGDSLVYYFCAPFDGGGNITVEPALYSCEGAKPDPSCPPLLANGFYNPVNYQAPFSGDNPLPGTLSIDPLTGFISGVPDRLGRYVVGVCVDEYRSDTLLSTSRRDFQFNIEQCDPEVDSRINADSVVAGVEYVFTNCGDFEVFFENQSVRREFIDEWFWRFDINGSPMELTTWDATVNFPDTGFYSGILVLNPNSIECSDTAIISVNINPRIVSEFNFRYDTCFGFPVQFINTSFSDGGPIAAQLWDFGDGNTSREVNPNHLYDRPGQYTISLEVSDGRGCVINSEKTIDFYPVPLAIVVDPIMDDNCAPVSVFFDNLSRPIDETYTILWDFGDGNTSNVVSPTHIYEEDGDYDVSLMITSINGCLQEEEFLNLVTLIESAEAGFEFAPENPKIDNPLVTFTDQSVNAANLTWDFAGLGSSTIRNPVFNFPDTGMFLVSQFAFHQNGCIDTAQAIVNVRPDFTYFLPNAFTPNGDGINDEYLGVGRLVAISNFSFTIYNRWGEQIYQTSDPNKGWNGRVNNSGLLAQPGVYLCYVTFTDAEGIDRQIKSFATLIQ